MEFAEAQTDIPGVVRVEARKYSVLDRYEARGEITSRQHMAGERLHEDWVKAGRQPPVIGAYREMIGRGSVAGNAESISDFKAIAFSRFLRAMAAVGPVASAEIKAVCLWNEPVGRIGLEILRRGLTVLADWYGLPTD